MVQSRVVSGPPGPPSTYANRAPPGRTLKSQHTSPSCAGRTTSVDVDEARDKAITRFSLPRRTDTKSVDPSLDHCGALRTMASIPRQWKRPSRVAANGGDKVDAPFTAAIR